MGACGVVVVAEFIEECLQFSDGFSGWSGVDPFFECLVEALDFSLSLGMAWTTIFLLDAVVVEGFLECVAASFSTCESCRKDQSVVGECGCGWPVGVDEVLERFCDCSACKRVL